MRKASWLIVGICFLLLIGCNEKITNHHVTEENDQMPTHTNEEQSLPESEPDKQDESTQEEQSAQEELGDNMQNETEPTEEVSEEMTKTYYMTSSYRFKPIDPEDETKVVLLTFDDGPKEEDMIDQMLEVLEAHNAKAIFFLNGYRIEANPELAVKLFEAGHALGNHSWDHIALSKESEDKIDEQIESVQNIIEELTGETPRFFRPPFAAGNDYVKNKAKDEGMLYMTWSNGSEDWVKKYQNPEGVIGRVMEQLHPGANILMHELPWTVEALDKLLVSIEAEGYTFLNPHMIDIDYTPSNESSQ